MSKHVRYWYWVVCYTLALLRPVEFPIKFDTVRSGWPIVYIEGSQGIISKKNNVFLSLKINSVLANSIDCDELLLHLSLHCLLN